MNKEPSCKTMNLPSHLKYYSKRIFLNTHKTNTENEFSPALKIFKLDFNKFVRKLNLLEKAVFIKIGFIFSYYIKKFECEKCKCSHQSEQLRLLACISVIEALLGNAKKKRIIKNNKDISEPIAVTFLTNNLLPSEKKELRTMMLINRDIKTVTPSFRTFVWRLVDMRNSFMHRAELIHIKGVYKHRLYRGRSGGIALLNNEFFDKLIGLIKISIVRYLLTPHNKRKPAMAHKIK